MAMLVPEVAFDKVEKYLKENQFIYTIENKDGWILIKISQEDLKMKFGIVKDNIGKWELVDLSTGEILTEGMTAVQNYLSKFENNYTLVLLQKMGGQPPYFFLFFLKNY